MLMNNRDPLSAQLEEIIFSVLLPLEESNVEIIDPAYIANKVDSLIDPGSKAPELKTYASTMRIREMTRKVLAKRHDPNEKAKDYAEGVSDDLFGENLQLRYPAKRQLKGNGVAPVYVLRDCLTEEEVEYNCTRMDKGAESLHAHSDALRAWFYNKSAA
jgi:hypothetical protein